MTRRKAFTTAAARRRADPIIWTIDETEVRLRAMVDITELGSVVEALQGSEGMDTIAGIAERRRMMIDLIAICVEPDDRDLFHACSDSLDVPLLVEMVQEVMAEYSGAPNPTKPESSSGGSSPTGASSTAGAPAEVSTLPL
jgi:hypothetical protein